MSDYKDHKWIPSGINMEFISEACLVGYDNDRDSMYAGRSEHCGDILPCIIIPKKCKAYVVSGGRTHEKKNYDILCKASYGWKFARNGNVPENAIEMGNKLLNGEKLYMGRVQYEKYTRPGIIYPSNGCLYIPYEGQVFSFMEYEVLITE